MLKILYTLLVIAIFSSCVSNSDHQQTVEEKNKLEAELNDIKFGAPNLLKDGKAFFLNNDFTTAREKFTSIIQLHPDMKESIEAKKYLLIIDEEQLWNTASNSEDITKVTDYITNYPNGKYIKLAGPLRLKLKTLNMDKAYSQAEQSNSSSAWKSFIKEYPNYPSISAIKRKIIQLEVEEILADNQTGIMPSFQQDRNGGSSSSSVSITNDTGCELTVRYSGVEVEMIIIPEGGTRTVSLASGNYKVAASACGQNYGGNENLSGSYSSKFYISTTRY